MTELTKDFILGIVSGVIGGVIAGIVGGLSNINLFSLILLTFALTGAVFFIVRLIIILWYS